MSRYGRLVTLRTIVGVAAIILAGAARAEAGCACSNQLCQLTAEQSALYLTCTMVAQGAQVPATLTSNLLGTLNLLAKERSSEFSTTCGGKSVAKLPALNGLTDLNLGILQSQALKDFATEKFPFLKKKKNKAALELFETQNDASCATLAQNFVIPTNPTIDLSTTSLAFGTVAVGNCSYLSFEFADLGTNQLTGTISGPDDSECNSTYTGTFCEYPNGPFSLNFGKAEQVSVQFCPTSTGPANAKITIDSNDPAHPSETVSLSGTGQ